MQPQEKAFSLLKKYNPYTASITQKLTLENARGAALLAVEEIIKELDYNYDTLHAQDRKSYWEQVKVELKNY